jgi:tetratricopeptide (TPR) repeat protein/transcriptional regulator with XRE-family HTH domain
MPNSYRLFVLTELRRAAGVTLVQMARACGLVGGKARDSVSAWERGKKRPHPGQRPKFVDYLGYTLGLHTNPERFHEIWTVLEEEWGWEPISEDEWRQHFGEQHPMPMLPMPAFVVEPDRLAAAAILLQQCRTLHSIVSLSAPLPAGSRMPLARNPLFVGRSSELQAISQALIGTEVASSDGQAILVIAGLGGIGKTQLASEFVHRYGQFFAGGVYWLRFADAVAVPSEVAVCGGRSYLNLHPDFDMLPLHAQVRLVRAAWESALPRLLVFDNCENEVLLDEWRPRTGGSRILITSRRAEWDAVLGVQTLSLRQLHRNDSLVLLQRLRPDLAMNDPNLDAIAAELGDLPLALHLAGSFLQRYCHAVTLAAYLADLRAAHRLTHRSLQTGGISPTQHDQHVARTFGLSYDQLNPTNDTERLAHLLLACASYFAPGEPIERDLVHLSVSKLNPSVTEPEVEDARSRLIELGLVMPEADGAFRIHRLLVAYLRQIAPDSAAQDAVEQALLTVAKRLNMYDSPPTGVLLSHLTAVTEGALKREDERAAELCYELSVLFYQIDAYERATYYNEQSLALRTAIYGTEHPTIVENLHHQGWMVDTLGRHKEAEDYHQRALDIRIATAGPNHPDTAESCNFVGTARHAGSDYAGARRCYEQALAIREQIYGDDHVATAGSLANMALLLHFQGKYAEAEPLHLRALSIRERLLGPDHHKVALSLNTLGYLYRAMARYVEAEKYLQQALRIREAVFGPTNSYTAVTLNHLGRLRHALGQYDAAQHYLEQALAIRQIALGLHHCDTANSLGNLGMLLFDQGDYDGAEPYLEHARTLHQRELGMNHRHTARSLNHLGLLRSAQRRLIEARQIFEQALAIREDILGQEHPNTANTLGHLGVVLLEVGEIAAAGRSLGRALILHLDSLGQYHPYTARSMMRLGLWHQRIGGSEDRFYVQQALTTYVSVLGERHPYTHACKQFLKQG